MTSSKGVEAYQSIMSRNPLYANLTINQRNAATRVLQKALDSKRLMETYTSMLIHELQKSCKVFALTKRFANSAMETRRELLALGIDFNNGSNPFPAGRKYFDELTESLLIDGVIYTNGHEKGPVLDRFLSQVLFQRHLDMSSVDQIFIQSIKEWSQMCHDPSTNQSIDHPCSSYSPLPINLVFVDDLQENAKSVFEDVYLCKRFDIPIYSCSYLPIDQSINQLESEYQFVIQSMVDESNDQSIFQHCRHTDMEVLQYQVYHLVHHHEIIGDQQAKITVTKLKHRAAQSTTQSTNRPVSPIKKPAAPTKQIHLHQSTNQSNDEPPLKMRAGTPSSNQSINQSMDPPIKNHPFSGRVDYMEIET